MLALLLSSAVLLVFFPSALGPASAIRVVPTLIAFFTSAVIAELLSNQRHRAEGALRAAGERLELAVLERTEQLERTNEELRREVAERERAEANLLITEERWRRVYEASAAGMALTRLDGKFMAANPAFQRMLGYTEEEIKGHTSLELTHPDERPATVDVIAEFKSGRRQEYHIEKRYLRKNGNPVWVNVTTALVPATESAEPFLQAIFLDITERKAAEAALRASEERWRRLFETSAAGMALARLDGVFIAANPAFQRIVDLTEDEIKGRTAVELTPEDEHPATMNVIEEFRRGLRQEYRVEKRYLRRNGSSVWVNVTTTLVPGTATIEPLLQAVYVDITERKGAEAALRASEERWRRVFESSAVPMALADGNRRIVAANPACERLLGYSHEEFMRMSALDFKYGDDRDVSAQKLAELEKGLHPDFQAEMRFRRKDGTMIWVHVSVCYVPAGETTPALFPAIIVDITERKRVEFERRRLASIVEQATDFMGIGDLDGTPIYVNEAGLKMVGLDDMEQAKKRRGTHYLFRQDRPFISEVVWPAVMQKGSWSGELRFRHFKTGQALPILYDAFRIDDPETGQAINTGFVCRDISERKHAEQVLRSSEERWRRLFETSSAGMAVATLDSKYIATNPTLQRMLGYTDEELRQTSAIELSHPEDRARAAKAVEEFVSGTRQEYHVEKRFLKKDGTPVWVNLTVTLISSAPAFLQAIYIDIGDRKKAEEALRQSQAELARVARLTTIGEFGASIAHEMNQPLAAIVASGNACRRWLSSGQNLGRAKESLDRIIADANRASEVIKRVRALTKKNPQEHAQLYINEVIEEVLGFIKGELQARQILVHKTLAKGLPSINGDRVQLQQVLLNLMINGIEAMTLVTDRARQLTVASYLSDSRELVVIIEDTGAGLDPKDAPRIFDAFFTTKSDGMGMGLSISTSIIEAHGGRLWVSPVVPHGTAFHFAIPAAREEMS